MIKTSFSIRGVQFSNRVFVASGTFGYGDECSDLADVNKLGGVIIKSLSMKPRDGNPPIRIVETPSGMLNSIGLANIGVERFVKEKLPFLEKATCGVIANIAASSIGEYCDVMDILEGHDRINGYEINVSCPNVKEGGLSFGTNCGMTAEITRRLRKRTEKPIIMKLTPNVAFISEFARAVEDEGADAVSVINTVIGMAVDVWKRKPVLSTVTGGLSGPAIKPIALAKVYETSKAVKIPVIGIGGIRNALDAVEFLMVGATAIQVGTQNFVDPTSGANIAQGIVEFCQKTGVPDVGDLVGSLDAEVDSSVLNSWL